MIPTSSSSSPVVQPKSCEAIADQSPAFLFFEIGMRTKETVNETIIVTKSKQKTLLGKTKSIKNFFVSAILLMMPIETKDI